MFVNRVSLVQLLKSTTVVSRKDRRATRAAAANDGRRQRAADEWQLMGQ